MTQSVSSTPFDASTHQATQRWARMRRKRVRGPVGDRWHMAMYHTVQGDVDLALQSLYDPYSVSPAHQAEFGETYLRQVNAATEDAEKRGFLKAVQRLAGDPLIWLGLVLTIPFPGVGRRAVQRYMGRAVDYRRRIGIFDKLGGAMGVLRDEMGRRTEALDLLLGGAHEMAYHTHRMNEILHQGVKRFRKISGARPTTRDVHETLMHAERWHDPKQRMWREIPAWTGRARDIGPIPFRLNPAQEELLRGWDEVRRYYFDHMIKPLSSSQKKTLRRELQHQGAFVELPTEASVPFYAHRTLYADEKIIRKRVKSLMAEDRVEEAFIIGSHAGGGNRAVSWEEYEAILLGDSIPAGVRQRHYVLLPSVDHMRVVEDRLKPGTIEAVEKLLRHEVRIVDQKTGLDVAFAPYSMDLLKSAGHYIGGMERFRAWNLSGRKKALRAEIKQIEQQNPATAQLVRNVFIPAAEGRMTHDQYSKAVIWESNKLSWQKTIREHPLFQSGPGKKVADWLADTLLETGTLQTKLGAENAVAGYLYMSTLGAKFTAVAANFLQTLATTAPLLGYRATMSATVKVASRLHKYGRLRLKGVDSGIAFKRAFPEYMAAGLEGAPSVSHEILATIEKSWAERIGQGKMGQVWSFTKAGLMMPFQMVEKWNWLVAFEAGLINAKKLGLPLRSAVPGAKTALEFARDAVGETQFMSGPLMRPTYFATWPAPARMFSQYISRLTSLYGTHGAKGLLKGQPGFAGRALLGGRVANELAKEMLGLDVTMGLAWDAMPFPTEGRPTSPSPWAPPILSIGVAAASDIASWEINKLRQVAPLLVPGGLAAASALSVVSERAARGLRRKYADFNAPTPDGRYPMYDARGRFVGNFTPYQITLTGLGFRVGDAISEQQGMKYLLSQRDVIREIRQSAREALAKNDMATFRIQVDRWKRMFPGIPFVLKPTDLQAIRDQRMLARAEGLRRNLPPGVRAAYENLLKAAVVQRAPTMFDMSAMRRVQTEVGRPQ